MLVTLFFFIIKLQAEKIQTILKAADVKVEPYWPGLFAKALDGLNLKSMITNVGSGVGAAPVAGAPASGNTCLITLLKGVKLNVMINGWFAKYLYETTVISKLLAV